MARKKTEDQQFQRPTEYQHVRMRPEIHLGSREELTMVLPRWGTGDLLFEPTSWVPAIWTSIREIIDNSLDEIVQYRHGDELSVTVAPDGWITVEDNGRGVPIHEIATLGKGPAASILLGEPRAGRNFGERGEQAGLNGLGGAMVNWVSEEFRLDVWRDAKHFHQTWNEGQYGGKDIHRTKGSKIVNGPKRKTGTRIEFRLSKAVFGEHQIDPDFIRDRLVEIAVQHPEIRVTFNGTPVATIRKRKNPDVLSSLTTILPPSRLEGVIAFRHEVDGFCSEYVVFPGASDEDPVLYGTVNRIPTFNGGDHIGWGVDQLVATLQEHFRAKICKKSETPPRRQDILRGSRILCFSRIRDAKFDSQAKMRLTNNVKRDFSLTALDAAERARLISSSKTWVANIWERLQRKNDQKLDAEVGKEQKALLKNRITDLTDATGSNRQKCILMLTEGLSALGGAMAVRDPAQHGGMALTGKILNTHGMKPAEAFQSKPIQKIMAALGLQFGDTNRSKLRYGKLWIASDMDEDGSNIAALVMNFLYTYWPHLFDPKLPPFVHHFLTPLVIITKGDTTRYIYHADYEKFQHDLQQGKYRNHTIIRAKGLGRLTKQHWTYCMQNPNVVPIVDDGSMRDTLDLIFNKDNADARKEWLS